MLPSSHPVPENPSIFDLQTEVHAHGMAGLSRIDESVLIQDAHPGEVQARSSALVLAEAFSEFISTSSRLENSYRDLQKEVYALGLELAERNVALQSSHSQNELMRFALQQIVDSMPCGVLVVEANGHVSTINPESARMLGVQPANFAGMPVTLAEISAVSGFQLEAASEREAQPDSERELCVRNAEGERWFQIRTRRMFENGDGEGKLAQTIFILRDVTQQKRSERDREAGRNAMALAEVTTVLAHEIRNPLASLELFAELIEQDDHRRPEWISNLRAGIRSLSGTVNNVLTLHGAGSLKLASVSLSTLIGAAVQFVQPLADQSSVAVHCEVATPDLPVRGNEGALRQVLLNLLSNAIRHTPAGGEVKLSMRSTNETCDHAASAGAQHMLIDCDDSGCGLRPEQIAHIFLPGFSGSGDTSGLGLAVCERIMKQHGGKIFVANREPSGARFTLQFPIFQSEATAA